MYCSVVHFIAQILKVSNKTLSNLKNSWERTIMWNIEILF